MLHTFAQHLTKYLNEQEIAQLIASLDAKRYQLNISLVKKTHQRISESY